MEISKFSVFAKMLARENLHLRVDPNAETAYINLKSNVIVVPNWACPDHTIRYIISHEVAHKLFTPLKKIEEVLETAIDKSITDKNLIAAHKQLIASILNIFEDHRIERLMLGKYPQLRNDYTRGQEYLMVDMDFFKLKTDNDPQSMNIQNKINYFSKTTYTRPANIPYKVSYDKQTQYFIDKMVKTQVYDDVIKVSLELYEILKDEIKFEENTETSDEAIDYDGRVTVDVSDTFKDVSKDIPRNTKANFGFNNNVNGMGDKIVPVPLKEVVSTDWQNNLRKNSNIRIEDIYHANKEFVRNFCSYFEIKKKGREFSRISTHHTGLIDTNSLHKYKYDDNIMLQTDVLHNQKKHAFFILVDCSGSMSDIFKDVFSQIAKFTKISQRLNVPLFCYGFVDDHNVHKVKLLEIYNSLKSKKENEEYMNNFLSINLTGTPLAPALYSMRSVMEHFTKRVEYDILNLMIITDGGDTSYWKSEYIQDMQTGIVVKSGKSPRDLEDNVGGALRIIKQIFNCRITYVDMLSGNYNLPTYLTEEQRDSFDLKGISRCKERNGIDNTLFINLENPLEKTLAKIFVDCLA